MEQNEKLRQLEKKEIEKSYRKQVWQEIKWSALEIIIDFLLMFVLPVLVSIATTVVMVAILSTILG